MFIRINRSDTKRDYDTDYEVSKKQTFISKFNLNKAEFFEGSFSWGEEGEFDPPPSYFKKNLSNFNVTLYYC